MSFVARQRQQREVTGLSPSPVQERNDLRPALLEIWQPTRSRPEVGQRLSQHRRVLTARKTDACPLVFPLGQSPEVGTLAARLLSKRAEDDGADALLVLSPPQVTDPRPYYERVATAVDIPVLAYHYPRVSAPGVPVDVLAQLPVAGIKDSSGEAERLILEAEEIAIGLYTGHPALVHLAGAIGCAGAILALANVDPEGCIRAWAGDGVCQRELINGHRAQALAGIAGLKRTLCALHGTSPTTRVG